MDMGTAGPYSWIQVVDRTNLATNYNLVLQPNGGNVGVGVTPSAWVSSSKAIDMAGWAAFGYIASSAATVISNNTYKDSASNWVFKNGSNAAGYFEIAQNLYRWWQAPAAGGAGTSGTFTQAMTLDASGRLLVGPTSANASGGILQLSSGITFPATQVASSDANTLDDYEEGTWTATLRGTITDPTTPVSSSTCRYTKIGRQVFVEGSVDGNTTGASGLVFISSLPFSSAAGSPERTGSVQLSNMATFTGYATAFISAGSANINFYASSSGAALGNVTHNPGASRAIWFAISYTV
jgi:hypothetical protein